MRFAQHRPSITRDIGKRSVMQVVICDLGLTIACAQTLAVDFRINMAIRNQDAGPTAVVEIKELYAPPQPILDSAQSSRVGGIVKIVISAIEIECWRVVAEVGFHNSLMA